jgi:nucleoid DNA-binding protein|tara:strand:- start:337 stop:552 length:216 start_codon:yes stop_codon:yes gene_type:complete
MTHHPNRVSPFGFFKHLSLPKFMRKLNERAIALPVTSIKQSQKSRQGVHIEDLAEFRDNRREARLERSPSL